MTVAQQLEAMNAESLSRGFKIKDAGAELKLHCKVCKKGWGLKKSSRHIGNVLYLLNHEAGHKSRI